MMRGVATALLAASLLLQGCDLAPRYARPGPPVPPAFPRGDAYAVAAPGEPPASLSWQQVFTDPRLSRVIALALANGRDLRIAAANVASARALYRVQRADLFPEIGAAADYRIVRNASSTTSITTGSGTGTDGAGTGTGTTGTGTTGTGTTGTGTTVASTNRNTVQSYSLDLGLASFEIDLFGRQRNLTRAAFEDYLATDAGARAARLSLVAETASAWLTLVGDRSLLAVARETARSAQATVDISARRFEAGITSQLDLESARTLLAQLQSDIANDIALVAQDRNALELLVGAPVDDMLLPATLNEVTLPAELPAGLSSTILLRRPDVVQAEHALIGANARIGAARAAFFPTISLTAAVGLASTALSGLFTGGAFNWSVAPSATLPIFDAGRNAGNLGYARAQRYLYLAQYEQAIQAAFRDVADALARRGTIDAQVAAQQRLFVSASNSLNLANARYQGGIDSYLNALDAQRTLYSAQQTLIATRVTQGDNLVTLYRVLGGDQRF